MNIRKATDRGHTNDSWLESYHSFSYDEYDDPMWRGFRSLRAINDDFVPPGMGYCNHPQRMEVITFLLSGAIEHTDSMGIGRIICTGEVEYMAVGAGPPGKFMDSIFNPSKLETAHFLQILIKPDERGVERRSAIKSFPDTGRFQLVTSKTGRDGSISIHQDADLWMARLEPQQEVAHVLAEHRHGWLHVAEGEVVLNGAMLSTGDAVAFKEATKLQLTAKKPSQILLFDLN